jgi:NAD-dependent SIR2 family protein deacetylase
MVPDIVLYDQEHPDADPIAEFQREDLSGAHPVDLLLVVGTGMHVVGTQRMVRAFAQHVHSNQPFHSLPQVIYLNLDFKQQRKWESTFDLWVQADCQLVAGSVLNEMKEREEAAAIVSPPELMESTEW